MRLLSVLVKDKKEKMNLSEREVARRVGVSPITVSRILKGETPDIDTLKKFAQWLDVSPSHILNGDVGGHDALALNMAAVLQANKRLARVFGLAMDRLLSAEISSEDFEELVRYAAFRLGISPAEISESIDGDQHTNPGPREQSDSEKPSDPEKESGSGNAVSAS